MASGAVWGIDIGQCALKALRCRVHEDGKRLVADAFDYIEYPKILSQPGSDRDELIGDALKQFLSRNSVLGDQVAVSVSGQAGLARFIKLPPVEAKKIPDMVRYEARQQIPFDLNDVIWDYQRMGVGTEEEGFALETEVGLFAMKRDAVLRALEPFIKADIEVDIVQLTPLVLYNFLCFDQLGDLPAPDEYDPENPPESVAIISLGTDATDLVISNGYRVWQRPIPQGGSHFTKALTKELKLTFAKAEHLKRNATAAADPKAVFQAMRPVFNDLLTELQRSFSYFSNLDRAAKIGRVIALGNAMKLPGLRRFLSQSLGYEIEKLESFRNLTGSQVVSAPSFQENLLSFPVAYGLALQGLAKSAVHTSLLPREITYDRLVKRKKPWAVAAAAVLLLGCGISFAAYSLALGTVDKGRWQTAEDEADRLIKEARQFKDGADAAKGEFTHTDEIGQHLVGNVEGRIRWLELLKAVNACLPADPPGKAENDDNRVPIAERIAQRKQLHITNLDCQQVDDVSQWYSGVKQYDKGSTDAGGRPAGDSSAPGAPAAAPFGAQTAVPPAPGGFAPAPAVAPAPRGKGALAPAAVPAAAPADATLASGSDAAAGPKGPGWIVQLGGYHYHNTDHKEYGAEYVRRTLIDNLRNKKVRLSGSEPGVTEEVTMSELGITCPVLVTTPQLESVELANPNADAADVGLRPGAAEGPMGPGGLGIRPMAQPAGRDAAASGAIRLQRFDFVVQFCWQPKTPTERRDAKKAKEKEQAANPAQPQQP